MSRDRIINLTGSTIGHWKVIEPVYKGGKYLCECECGVIKEVLGSALVRNMTFSCGCKRNEKLSKKKIIHGHTSSKFEPTPEYRTWSDMKKRCNNPNVKSYKDYGGRGIKVCDRWLGSFQSFLDDMGARPSDKHSLDRIDVNGNYDPVNCRWSTIEEQSHNKRVSRNNKSGYSGIIWRVKANKWEVNLKSNSKNIYLGSYKNIEDAIKTRIDAELKYWGKQPS